VNVGKKAEFSVVHELIYELRVKDAMSTFVIAVNPENTLRDVQQILKNHRISGTPVVDNDELVGIVSIEDIINALDHGYIEEKVSKWMTKKLITIRDNMSLIQAEDKLDRFGIRRLPVLDENNHLVGIITRSDIITKLLLELNKFADEAAQKEIERIAKASRITKAHDEKIDLEVDIGSGDFDNVGLVAQEVEKELKKLGVEGKIVRKTAIAIYEAEANIIIHSIGGKIIANIFNDRVEITAIDFGPGIKDIEQAMQEGYSTASAFVQTMGFGAGMGLANIKRCSDKFEIKSSEAGTVIKMIIFFEA